MMMSEYWKHIVDNTNILELINKGIEHFNEYVDEDETVGGADEFYSQESIDIYHEDLRIYNNDKSYENYILSWVGEYIATEVYNLSLNNKYDLESEWYEEFMSRLQNDDEVTEYKVYDPDYIKYMEEADEDYKLWSDALLFNEDNDFDYEIMDFDDIINNTNIKELLITHTKKFFKNLYKKNIYIEDLKKVIHKTD